MQRIKGDIKNCVFSFYSFLLVQFRRIIVSIENLKEFMRH